MELNQPETNIMTAEDPVEFNLLGINQVQMHEAIGRFHAEENERIKKGTLRITSSGGRTGERGVPRR